MGGTGPKWVRGPSDTLTKWVPGREWIDIPMPASGEEHEVAVSYSATPQLGLHFRGGRGSSDPVLEAWTQGENEDNRYWFPGWDYPNDKFSLDLHIDAASELMAFGNGVLVSKEDRGDKTRWHYRLERPIVNYLVALGRSRR